MKTRKRSHAGALILFLLIALPWSGSPGLAQPQPGAPLTEAASPGAEDKGTLSNQEIPDWQARWELARLLSYLKRYEQSLAEYEKVLREKPDLLDARIEMALVHSWSGNAKRALDIFKEIPADKLDDRARLAMADAYAAGKMYDRAEPIYRGYLERRPDDLRVRLKLAELLSWTKRYDESLPLYEAILKARPNDVQVRRKYAFVLSWAGRHEEAVRELKKTLD
ncbi:MAG: tetratricopeptide repeat protein [Deltaproteobacteria bacterium]|nr:tetratricopeptide repeat protein [Deltaproteobacteria bacterium]